MTGMEHAIEQAARVMFLSDRGDTLPSGFAERQWDECVREGEACGYIGAHDAIELGALNPYREPVDRAEGDGSADR